MIHEACHIIVGYKHGFGPPLTAPSGRKRCETAELSRYERMKLTEPV